MHRRGSDELQSTDRHRRRARRGRGRRRPDRRPWVVVPASRSVPRASRVVAKSVRSRVVRMASSMGITPRHVESDQVRTAAELSSPRRKRPLTRFSSLSGSNRPRVSICSPVGGLAPIATARTDELRASSRHRGAYRDRGQAPSKFVEPRSSKGGSHEEPVRCSRSAMPDVAVVGSECRRRRRGDHVE